MNDGVERVAAVEGGLTQGANWRKRPRIWTPAKLWRLAELLERGWDDARIGAELGCSANAVNLARKRHGLRPRSQSLLSAREVARLMGVSCSKTVGKWIERGYLAGRRGQQIGPYRQWYVTRTALLAFIERADYWHLWAPERIADDGLRYYATQLRAGTRFLTPGQVAERFCVQHAAVNDWIHKGWLPAVRWGNWWVREEDAARFELRPIGGYRRKQAA